MRKFPLAAICVGLLGLLFADVVRAQEEDEEPPTRIVTVTSFELPFTEREKVFPWMEEYFLPGIQLNPNVRNFRMMVHFWGSDAAQVILVSEYDDWAAIDAECGAPCEEYFDAHPEPEEGDEGFEEFDDAAQTFGKYYAKHRDEIYTAFMNQSVVEGTMMGTVGPDPEEEED